MDKGVAPTLQVPMRPQFKVGASAATPGRALETVHRRRNALGSVAVDGGDETAAMMS